MPQAKRILDFSHAASYVADAGKVVWGEGTASFQEWFERTRHQLKQKPPKHTLNELSLLLPKAESDEAIAIIDQSIHYLRKRLQQIDYPYFRARGLPIGSGSVESAHKVVVHSRLKQAGMRWADVHVDPMLALRNLVCNGRWQEGWSQIVAYHWQQQHKLFRQQSQKQRPFGPAPVPNSVPAVAPPAIRLLNPPNSAPRLDIEKQKSHRPAADHPWRQGIWPSKEAWRWN